MMKKHYIAFMAAAAITALPASAQPWDLQSLLNKAGNALGDKETVSNIVEGLFTTSDLDIKDLAGEWMVKGSASQKRQCIRQSDITGRSSHARGQT